MYYYSYAIMYFFFFKEKMRNPEPFSRIKTKTPVELYINALTFIHIAFSSKDLSYIYMILHLFCILFYLLVMMIEINVTSSINNNK